MKAHLLLPRENYNGNLIWRKEDFIDKVDKTSTSLEELRALGYWASPFPEGDGITFSYKNDNNKKNNIDIIEDFRECFEWVDIELAKSVSSNIELAELEDERKMMKCTVIVPIEKVFIQETISLGQYTLYCEKQFDENPNERLSEQEGSYIQFDCQLPYIVLAQT